ncbi:hypothetical protein D0T57_13740 [Dysgonomonas sp. 511]|nr:hypothetical protein [Dysgonomonas sp. 511]
MPPLVIFEPVNGTVWLHKSELPSLFCVTVQAINAVLCSISKGHIVDIKKTCIYDLCVKGSCARYDLREVNLEVIIAMAFRINSPYAEALRKWVIERCLHPGISYCLPLDMEQQAGLN